MRVALADGEQLAVAIDTLVGGVHFPAGSDPFDVGYKAVGVNLSDLAAMGATPLSLSATLLIEEADPGRAAALHRGMAAACRPRGLETPHAVVKEGAFNVSVCARRVAARGGAVPRRGPAG